MVNNRELRALREEQGVYEAAALQASIPANPVLELNGATAAIGGSPADNSVSIGVTQEFLTAGKREKRRLVADRDLDRYRWQLLDRERLLRDEVQELFYRYLLAKERVALAERAIQLARELVAVAKERLAAGDIPELDANLALVEVARGEEKKAEAERDLEPARLRLASLVGLSPAEAAFDGSLEVTGPSQGLAELSTLALKTRPDLKALEADEAKGDAEVAVAQAERYPNVTAGVSFSRERTSVDVGSLTGTALDYLVGARLSIPIPLFDRNQCGIRRAQSRKDGAHLRYLAARSSVTAEVEAAYARLTAADKSLAIYRRNIMPQLEDNLKLTQEAYRLGEVGILAVLEEQKKFIEVADGYLAALHDKTAALGNLVTAVGVPGGGEPDGGM